MVVEYVAETSGLGNAVTALAALGVAAVGVAAVSVKMAGDFEQGVTRLKTGAGDVTDNMAEMGKSILATSVATGVLTNGAEGLNAAMYLIISSGQRGGQSLDTLKVAAEGAQIEQANVVEVANTLRGVMTNYGTKTFNATQYMNGLIAAVQQGKISLEDLAVSMGPVDPIAQSLGISFNDMAAAMTTQTNAMIPAARAATGLRFMMEALENPTGKAKDAMKALGLDSVAVAEEMKVSLPGALQMIANAAKKVGPEGSVPFNRAVADMVGGLRSLSTFSALTGEHMKDFTKNSATILAAMQKNKSAVEGWETAQSNFNIKFDQAKAAVASVAIQLGTMLLPILGNLLTAITPLIVAFGNWITSGTALRQIMSVINPIMAFLSPIIYTLGQVFKEVGSVFMSSLIPALKQLMEALKPAMPAFQMIGEIILGIVVVAIAILIGLVTGLAMGIAASIGGIIQIFTGLVEYMTGMFNFLGGIIMFFVDLFTGQWGKLGGDLARIWTGITQMFHGAWDVIAGIFNAAAGLIGGIVYGFIKGVIAFFVGLWDSLVGHSIVPDMINGIVSWFAQLPGRALGAVQGLLGMIGGFFTNLASQALTWGSNIVKGIADGITSAIHWVTSAISSVGQAIANFLPHSPAKEGPLVDLENTGTEISNQIAKGMVGGTSLIDSAIGNMLKPVNIKGTQVATDGSSA